jgi:vitamin B12 transporter
MSKFFFLAAVLILSASLSKAQTDTVKETKKLDEVVITASKVNLKQSQTGKVIIVISKEEIEKSEAKSLGQLLNEQAGVIIGGALNDAGTNQSIYIRGATSGRVLVLIDGIPVYDPSITDNSFDLNLMPIDGIERIEICKGAQSTLYGSDAIAGVINIITTRTDPQKPLNLKANLAGGSYGTIRGGAQLYGKIADDLVYNVRYNKYKTDGFPMAYDSTGKGHFSNDGYNGDALAASLTWKALSHLQIKGFAEYNRYITNLPAGAFTDAQDYTNTSKNILLGGSATYQLRGTSLHANYQYATYDRQLLEDSVDGQSY